MIAIFYLCFTAKNKTYESLLIQALMEYEKRQYSLFLSSLSPLLSNLRIWYVYSGLPDKQDIQEILRIKCLRGNKQVVVSIGMTARTQQSETTHIFLISLSWTSINLISFCRSMHSKGICIDLSPFFLNYWDIPKEMSRLQNNSLFTPEFSDLRLSTFDNGVTQNSFSLSEIKLHSTMPPVCYIWSLCCTEFEFHHHTYCLYHLD